MEQKSNKLLRKTDSVVKPTSVEDRKTIVQKRLTQKKTSTETNVNTLLTTAPLSMINTMSFIDTHNKHASTIKHDDNGKRTISDDKFFETVSRLASNR